MGNSSSIDKFFSFEDVQTCIRTGNAIIIHTLPIAEQKCLIYKTTPAETEETTINAVLQTDTKQLIVIYGKNCNDETVNERHTQLVSLGFQRVYIYRGGMFEWLCLQDIYGNDEFPTTARELDILKFKPISKLNTRHLTNG
jgi:hypothetical protein